MSMLLALLLTASPTCDIPAAERERQMRLTYEDFDSVPAPHGWRALNAAGCADMAVAMLNAYRTANLAKLSAEQGREIPFHIGQAFAFAGRDGEAERWFGLSDSVDAPEEWRAYVAAHLAFFRHDRIALADARARYIAATVKPDSMRLKFIDGFLECPDKSYMEAAHCAM